MKKMKQMLLVAVAALLIVLVVPDNAQAASTVKLDKKSLTTYVGGQTQLTMTGNAKNVKWSSSKTSVASVTSKGLVTAKKAGKAVITVKSGSKKATCTVTVKKQLSAKQAVAQLNSKLKKATCITVNAYQKSIKKSNYILGMGINTKKQIIYMDAQILGVGKIYTTKNRTYWYDSSSKKWYYQKNESGMAGIEDILDEVLITSGMKYKGAGVKKFNGKNCYTLQVTADGETAKYYLDLSDYSLVGVESGTGSEKMIMVVDTKASVTIPSSVTKNAKYKAISTN